MTQISNFHQAISTLLGAKLNKHTGETVTRELSLIIYNEIFETLVELFTTTKAPLDNEGLNYIAQQYYDGILINKTDELDPNIFTQRAQLENIPTKELAFMAVILEGTDFRLPVLEMIKRRS